MFFIMDTWISRDSNPESLNVRCDAFIRALAPIRILLATDPQTQANTYVYMNLEFYFYLVVNLIFVHFRSSVVAWLYY